MIIVLLNLSTLKMFLRLRRLFLWVSYTPSNELGLISSDNIWWEIYCDLASIFRTTIPLRSRQQERQFSSPWLRRVEKKFMDGMLCVDICRRKSSSISIATCHRMKGIRILSTKKLQSWGKLSYGFTRRKDWQVSKSLRGIIVSNIVLTRSRYTNAIHRSMEIWVLGLSSRSWCIMLTFRFVAWRRLNLSLRCLLRSRLMTMMLWLATSLWLRSLTMCGCLAPNRNCKSTSRRLRAAWRWNSMNYLFRSL